MRKQKEEKTERTPALDCGDCFSPEINGTVRHNHSLSEERGKRKHDKTTTETERPLFLFTFFLSPIHEQTEEEGATMKRQGTIEKITKKRSEKRAGEIFTKNLKKIEPDSADLIAKTTARRNKVAGIGSKTTSPSLLEKAAAAAKQVPGIGNEITSRNSGGNSGHRELQRTRRKSQENTARINRSRHTNDGNKKQVPLYRQPTNKQTNESLDRTKQQRQQRVHRFLRITRTSFAKEEEEGNKTKQKNTKANPRTEPVASQNPPKACFGQETPELRTPRTLETKSKITAEHMHAHVQHQSSNQNE